MQFCITDLTPKAFANSSPRLERSDNPGYEKNRRHTLKGFVGRRTLSGFIEMRWAMIPGLSLRSNPGLELANAFGVICEDLLQTAPLTA